MLQGIYAPGPAGSLHSAPWLARSIHRQLFPSTLPSLNTGHRLTPHLTLSSGPLSRRSWRLEQESLVLVPYPELGPRPAHHINPGPARVNVTLHVLERWKPLPQVRCRVRTNRRVRIDSELQLTRLVA